MSRILVIGGYGGFGARLSRRLLAAGHEVLVAGRSMEKAAAFCAGIDRAEPVVADRAQGIGMVLARHRPDLVIDAAGPFQTGGLTVPEACIAMRIPYLDLADGRDFVAGIGALDRDARAGGIAVIAGASSVPALSGAVVRELARGMERVERVEMAISASNRASAGASVAAAILSYVGRPVRLWRGGRWTSGFGWHEMRREDFRLADGSGLGPRLVALADVPDPALVPERLPGRPSVVFRAGTELGFQMVALWLLGWAVRGGWVPSLLRWERWLMPLYRMTLGLGSDCSAMRVTVEGDGVERIWTLVASDGDGPEIPVLAAQLLAEDMLAGKVAPGARDAWDALTLDRFQPLFAALSIRHEVAERPAPSPLYIRLMGWRFAELPQTLQAMHSVQADQGAAGEGRVERGRGRIARLIGAIMRMPPAGAYPVHVHFDVRDGRETWTRDFGGHRFRSELSDWGGVLAERFGPLRFGFALPSDAAGLRMEFVRWSVFGIRLPRWLGPRIDARESQQEGRFRFEVEVRVPLIGMIVRYTGWLIPTTG